MESDAFVDAHRRHAAAVYARCRRILRDSEAARDVTQEVFIRCFDRRAHMSRFHPTGPRSSPPFGMYPLVKAQVYRVSDGALLGERSYTSAVF